MDIEVLQEIAKIAKADAAGLLIRGSHSVTSHAYLKDLNDSVLIKLSEQPESTDVPVATMNDTEDGYVIIIQLGALKKRMEYSWRIALNENKIPEFNLVADKPAAFVCMIIKSVFHEMRHVRSAIFERTINGKDWYDAYIEEMKVTGYTRSKYERMARNFEKLCWPTCMKFLNLDGTLKKDIFGKKA